MRELHQEKTMNNYTDILGKEVIITIDRPLGSAHPKYSDQYYPINYGYVVGIIGGDGEEQDVYLLGVDVPVSSYEAIIIAVIRRDDDIETKWVAAPVGVTFTKDEIKDLLYFQEQYFQSTIYC